jgi:hypothetical protein
MELWYENWIERWNTNNIKSTERGRYIKHFFFVEIIDDLLNQNSTKINAQLPKQRINCCYKTIFLYPVTEYGIQRVWKV